MQIVAINEPRDNNVMISFYIVIECDSLDSAQLNYSRVYPLHHLEEISMGLAVVHGHEQVYLNIFRF